MDTYTCPKGNSSTESDFCSDCGAKIQSVEPQAAAAPAAGERCPECGAESAAVSGNFCEVCGRNFAAGAPKSGRPPKGWTVMVAVDPSLREPESPDSPPGVQPFTVSLDKPLSLIGRRSESRAVHPEIALNFDAAVSHRRALLERDKGGAPVLRDIGAANGARLNDVTAMVDIPIHDGDRRTLGHWTRITIKAVRR